MMEGRTNVFSFLFSSNAAHSRLSIGVRYKKIIRWAALPEGRNLQDLEDDLRCSFAALATAPTISKHDGGGFARMECMHLRIGEDDLP